MRELTDLDYRDEFDRKWGEFSPQERPAIDREIARRIDELVTSPNANWGSILNTSIEGGKVNPHNGVPGDGTGTPYEPILRSRHCCDEQRLVLSRHRARERVAVKNPTARVP